MLNAMPGNTGYYFYGVFVLTGSEVESPRPPAPSRPHAPTRPLRPHAHPRSRFTTEPPRVFSYSLTQAINVYFIH